MRRLSSAAFLIIVMIISVTVSPSFAAERVGTIETKGGERFENVTYEINTAYKVITIKLADSEKHISFDRIAAIYDSAGNDVSAEILGGYRRPPETWRSESDPFVQKYRRKLWNVGLRLAANYSIPSDDYYTGFKAGLGFEGDFIVALSENIALRSTVSKSGMKVDKNFFTFIPYEGVEILSQDFSINAMRYLLALQYYTRPDTMAPGRTMLYAYTGLGIIDHALTAEVTYRYNNQFYEESGSKNETKFLTHFGGGLIVMISRTIGLDFGGEFDMVYVSSTSGGMANAFIFDFKAGIILYM